MDEVIEAMKTTEVSFYSQNVGRMAFWLHSIGVFLAGWAVAAVVYH